MNTFVIKLLQLVTSVISLMVPMVSLNFSLSDVNTEALWPKLDDQSVHMTPVPGMNMEIHL